MPISTRHVKYANEVMKKLRNEEIRAELDDRNATLPGKIRDAQIEKIPYMLVVGDKEEKSGSISVRLRNEEDLGPIILDKFIMDIKNKVDKKSLEL